MSKLKRLREWVSTRATTLPEFPVKIDAGRFYAMDETLREIDRLLAEPEAAPPVVHLSDAMHPEFVSCGKDAKPDVKRSPREAVVTCLDCLRIAAMGEAAARPEPDAAPTTCDLCNGSMAEGTDGHGLGECVPVCPTCDGSGSIRSDDAGPVVMNVCEIEHLRINVGVPYVFRVADGCDACARYASGQAAPTDAEVEAAMARIANAAIAYDRSQPDSPREASAMAGKAKAFDDLRALIARRVAAPVTDHEVDEWQANMVAAAGGAADLPLVEKVVADGVRLMRRPKADDGMARVRESVAALETVATKQQKVELRDAAHRILNGQSPCMNCGTWSRGDEGHSPCNPIAASPPAGDGLLAAAKAVLRDLDSINPNIRDSTLDALNKGIAAREAGGAQ